MGDIILEKHEIDNLDSTIKNILEAVKGKTPEEKIKFIFIATGVNVAEAELNYPNLAEVIKSRIIRVCPWCDGWGIIPEVFPWLACCLFCKGKGKMNAVEIERIKISKIK